MLYISFILEINAVVDSTVPNTVLNALTILSHLIFPELLLLHPSFTPDETEAQRN